jgi:hypothetical protein
LKQIVERVETLIEIKITLNIIMVRLGHLCLHDQIFNLFPTPIYLINNN